MKLLNIWLIKKFFSSIINNPIYISKEITENGTHVLRNFYEVGVDYLVPKDPKTKLMEFLESHGIPLYQQVYSVALKRYLKHDPVLYNEIGPFEGDPLINNAIK